MATKGTNSGGPGLGDIALSGARAVATNVVKPVANIIEFVEAPWGINMALFPVQNSTG